MLGAFMYLLLWVPLNLARRFWWRWTVEGLENLPPRGQGMIIAVNHINWTDIHILGASFPYSHRLWWVAKVELYGNKIATWFFRNMQVIPIKRGKRDLSALTAAEEALKQGAVLLIFPEGHRSGGPGLLEGRGGAVRLAVWTGCPIVPVAIYGTEHGLRGAASRKPIHVRIGKPYHPQFEGRTIPADKMDALTDEMMLHIAGLLPEEYWGFYRTRMLQNVEVR
jgi:1-acyl-sn-glycerol-3-phosphate acyltransferase